MLTFEATSKPETLYPIRSTPATQTAFVFRVQVVAAGDATATAGDATVTAGVEPNGHVSRPL